MSAERTAPPNARMVYALLIAIGVVSALIAAATISVIGYNYATRVELREPTQERSGEHASLPDWIAAPS